MQLRHFEWAKGQWPDTRLSRQETYWDRPNLDGRRAEISLRDGGVQASNSVPRGRTRARGVTYSWSHALAQSVRSARKGLDIMLTYLVPSCPEVRLSVSPSNCLSKIRVSHAPPDLLSLS